MADSFRYAEHLLYSFPVNMMRIHDTALALQQLRNESDCHAQNYQHPPASDGSHSDPVAAFFTRISQLEHSLKRLQEEVSPVERVREFLRRSGDERDSDMLFVMELYYFEKMKLEDVAAHLQKSVKTIARRRQELAGLVIYELEHP